MTLPLGILIGQPTQASTCSLLYEHHLDDELLDFAAVQRMKCLLRIYLLQKGDERERKKISLKKRYEKYTLKNNIYLHFHSFCPYLEIGYLWEFGAFVVIILIDNVVSSGVRCKIQTYFCKSFFIIKTI